MTLLNELKMHGYFWVLLLDIATDINATCVFFAGQQFAFSGLACLICLASFARMHAQGGLTKLWSQYCRSVRQGSLTESLHATALAEKSFQAPCSLALQYYAFYFVSMSSSYTMVSLTLSLSLSFSSVLTAAFAVLFETSLEPEQLRTMAEAEAEVVPDRKASKRYLISL